MTTPSVVESPGRHAGLRTPEARRCLPKAGARGRRVPHAEKRVGMIPETQGVFNIQQPISVIHHIHRVKNFKSHMIIPTGTDKGPKEM